MLLLLHLLVAFSSVAFSSYLLFSPTKKNFYITYSLVGLTLASGTILVFSTHAKVLQACLSGLTYLGVISVAIVFARRRLSIVAVDDKKDNN